MWKKKLCSSLSTILRRSLPSASHLPINYPSRVGFLSSHGASISSHEDASGKSGTFYNIPSVVRSYCCSQPAKENLSSSCWICGAAAPFLFCESCRSVQPVDESVDYFQIFGLEKNYEIEGTNLDGKYKEWQKKLHPDLVQMKSEQEKEYAAQQSARVIDAYRTLSKPLARAVYILKLEGVDVDEEETVSEPELLMEILEIREAVDEAADSRALNQIRSQMEDKLKHWSNAFASAIRSRKFEDAVTCVRRMKYYARVNEEIEKKL